MINLSETKEEKCVKKCSECHQSLFLPHGGWSDLHYWHDDFQIRKEVNDDISTLTEIIADYLLEGLK